MQWGGNGDTRRKIEEEKNGMKRKGSFELERSNLNKGSEERKMEGDFS